MKNSLIEMLMNFFEKSLSQLKASQLEQNLASEAKRLSEESSTPKAMVYRAASEKAMRIFTYEEQMKLTKASYQFIIRLSKLGIIAPEAMEIIIHHLMLSESRLISLNETKWTLRDILGEGLDANQLAFLDLLLYQKEDKLTRH
ncbi:MAG: DUF494 family protein [Legionellaceae bacterium]|nr:DUF494 family protein [Legionellaceae bacterium]